MMAALAKIRRAGFDVALDGERLKVVGASKLTTEQRAFLKEHKTELMAELRKEQEPATAAEPPPRSTHIQVCCGDCRHSVLPPSTEPVYGWRTCGLGVEGGGGFARQERRCGQFAV